MSIISYSQTIESPILHLHVVQADYGDCLLLQYGTEGTAKHILIDGGPDGAYANHLKFKLQEIAAHLDILVANPNDSTTMLQQQYPTEKYSYNLIFLAPDQHSVVV